jgi:hypothetical protein
MLGNLSKIGAVAAISIMIPTALSAQMGGAVNPGVHVGGTINAGGRRSRGRRPGYPWPGFWDLALAEWRSSPYPQA